jgi:urea transporter
MLKTTLRVLIAIIIGFVSGIIGWIIGALIGGNFAEQFIFNGVQGYEATGQVGFNLAALIGLILSWRFLVKRQSL